MTIYPKLIHDALATVRYPGNGKSIMENEMLEDDLRIDGMKVSFSLIFEKETDPFKKSVVKAAEAAIKTFVHPDVEVTIGTKAKTSLPPEPDKLLSGVKNIIAVSSGKGGVGKSTVTANLAIGLAKLGYRVGLLDTDIFGPSMPKMFGVEEERPYATKVDGRDLIVPIEKYGVKLLSIGFFVNHIHLTLLQTLGITGAIIVSTPQQVALADARKGINMYMNDKVNVPILGLVENMAWFTPAELPENKYFIFGKDGCKHLAEELQVPLLAQIPLIQSVCEDGDKGEPAVLSPASPEGIAFMSLAAKVVTQVDKRNLEMAPTHRIETHNS